jgi:hypothetical protein
VKSVREQLRSDIDLSAAAITSLRRNAYELHKLEEKQRVNRDEMEADLRLLFSKGFFSEEPELLDELRKMEDRLQRLRELSNMSEYGSFSIQVHNTMQRAWENLP